MAEPTERLLADYVAGKLAPAEQRQLAQAALDDDALFDALTVHGAMEEGLRKSPELRATVAEQKVVAFPWKRVTVGAIAAGVTIFGIYTLRAPAPPAVVVTQVPKAAAGAPVLLARELQRADAPVFRGEAGEGRLPQAVGAVVSVDEDVVTVNVGSVDGVGKGTELAVLRGEHAVGRLQVTTVFRERSRARKLAGGEAVRAQDQVHVPDAVYRAAVEQRVAGLAARGEAGPALDLMRKSPAAVDAALANDLGAYFLRRGDLERAEASLALAGANPRAANNLGALYEARGDRAKAVQAYADALRANPVAEDRRTIEANLARLQQVP